MNRKTSILIWPMLAALGIVLQGTRAHAGALNPHASNLPVPIVPAGTVHGFVEADTMWRPFTLQDGTTGTVRELVIEDFGNPFAAGDLTFAYQVRVRGTDGVVEKLTGFNYTGSLIDVVQEQGPEFPYFDPGTTPATSASRVVASTIAFNYANGILPGENSYIEYARTNATQFRTGNISVIDGGTQTLDGFAPVPVPEPATIALCAAAGLSLGGVSLRRRWNRQRT